MSVHTVGELVEALKLLPQSAEVFGRNPPWGGIKVIQQENGGVLLAEAGEDRSPGAKSPNNLSY